MCEYVCYFSYTTNQANRHVAHLMVHSHRSLWTLQHKGCHALVEDFVSYTGYIIAKQFTELWQIQIQIQIQNIRNVHVFTSVLV